MRKVYRIIKNSISGSRYPYFTVDDRCKDHRLINSVNTLIEVRALDWSLGAGR